MTLSGYSRETRSINTSQTFDSRDRNIDAEALEASDLIELFEPNEGSSPEDICSYDRIAKTPGPYYLVAERGVGKTHSLGLLGVILNKRGDLVLKIELTENRILSAYEKLKKELPSYEQKAAIWQVAILEETSLALVDRYLQFINDADFKKLPPIKRTFFRKNFRNNLSSFYSYLRKYRKGDWGKYHQLEQAFQETSEKSVSILAKILSRIQIQISPIRLGLGIAPAMDQSQVTSPADSKTEKKTDKEEISVLSSRMLDLEEWFWSTLALLRGLNRQPVHDLGTRLTRYLPKVHSVYILADGLDQTMKPLSHADLLALNHAARYLNRKAIKKLKEGEELNFKFIVSFRAVTFNYYIKPKDPDLEQIYHDIEKLAWDNGALRHMMAKRILETDTSLPRSLTVDEILQKRFPPEIHYFGRVFSPTPEFFFRFAGYRPRQIILLWHSCAEKAGGKDRPYRINLNEDQVIDGFRQYSFDILPEDIAKEYAAEYRGLHDLLKYFATRRDSINREISIEALALLIQNFVAEYRKNTRRNEPRWMQNGTDEIIDTIYNIGLISVLAEQKDTDWPKLRHVYEEPFLKASNFSTLYIRPPMWNFMTNIQNETVQRRKYMLDLYSKLKKSAVTLTDLFDVKEHRKQWLLESTICQFLILGKLIKDYARYPEPVDWRHWNNACTAIDQTWAMLSQLAAWQASDRESAISRIDSLADSLLPLMIKSRAKAQFEPKVPIFEKFETFRKEEQYMSSIEPLREWLDLYESSKQPQITQMFYASLIKGPESLNPVLGKAVSLIKPLV
jgi:hypothetical protein